MSSLPPLNLRDGGESFDGFRGETLQAHRFSTAMRCGCPSLFLFCQTESGTAINGGTHVPIWSDRGKVHAMSESKTSRRKSKADFAWEPSFDGSRILKKLSDCRTISDGRCSWHAAIYRYWLPILDSAITAPPQVGSLKSLCVRRALNDPELKLSDANAFLDRCALAFEQQSKKAPKPYVLYCSITYDGPSLINEVQDDRCRIRWQRGKHSKFHRAADKAREKLSDVLRSYGVSTRTEGLTHLFVETEAHTDEEAYEVTTKSVDKLRGILNLVVNRHRQINKLGFMPKPHAINRFRPGPYATLHRPDGALAVDEFWYWNDWRHDLASVKFSEPPAKVRRDLVGWWKRAHDNPLAAHVAEGLLRYCRALDQHETDSTLIGLWGALESLTCTARGKSYDTTVDRVTRLLDPHEEVRQIALHIRSRRNSTIHRALSPKTDEIDVVLTQAEVLVAETLRFCLRNKQRLKSSQELSQYLDLPLNEPQLRRTAELIGARIASGRK